jgi:peroxiredoxin Q/BCP
VSTDTAKTHAAFAERHDLPFPLISDRSAEIAGAFGVARIGGWLPTRRVTFVIDRQGVVQAVIRSELDVDRHVDEAIATLERL